MNVNRCPECGWADGEHQIACTHGLKIAAKEVEKLFTSTDTDREALIERAGSMTSDRDRWESLDPHATYALAVGLTRALSDLLAAPREGREADDDCNEALESVMDALAVALDGDTEYAQDPAELVWRLRDQRDEALTPTPPPNEPTRCTRCVGEIGRVRVTGRRGGVFCSERCADQSDYDKGVSPDELESAPPPSELAGRLEAKRLHPEIHEGLVPALRGIADRMEPEYRQGLRDETGAYWAEPMFLSSDRAFLREAADEIEAYRLLVDAAARALRSAAEGDAEPVAWLVDCYVDGKWYDRYVRFEPPTVKQIKSDDYRITPLRAPARHGESA